MVNERIRQHTAEVLFQYEQQECLQEGVAMDTIRSLGNQPAVLDFFFQVQSNGDFLRGEGTGEGNGKKQLFPTPRLLILYKDPRCRLFNC